MKQKISRITYVLFCDRDTFLSCSSSAPPGAPSRGRRPSSSFLLGLLKERAAASHILCSVILPVLPLLPQHGDHHTLSANHSSAPPSPSHHLSFQGNRAPRSPSLSVSILKGAASSSSSSSLPSTHPTVPS